MIKKQKIKISKQGFWLFFVLFLAFVLRMVALTNFPAGFTPDEAAQGYTAYSILKTGKDEWGVRLPLTPRSFGDYKPPLQTYLMIPSIAVFGLNKFAVRLPNAIFGILAILATFLLVKELFANSAHLRGPRHAGTSPARLATRSVAGRRESVFLGLLAALLLAISPWHISLSRGAFEANLTVFFMSMGFWLFLKGLKQSKYLLLASVFFGLNLFTYHAARLLTPLLVIILVIWGRKKLIKMKKKRKELVLGGVIFAFFVLLAFYSTLTGGGTRMADIGIFSAGFEAPGLFLDNYFSYLSLRFLFTHGAKEAAYGMIPGRGVVYLFELPFLVFALYILTKRWDRNFAPILAWLVLAPIPAALTHGVGYHANRVAVMMPAIQILSAYGGILLWWRVKKRLGTRASKIVLLFYCSIVLLPIGLFVKDYFLNAPKINAPAMSYGWEETIAYLQTQEANYEKIIISRRFSEPQAFTTFYKAYPPEETQKESANWRLYEEEGLFFLDQLGEYSLGQYEFRNLHFPVDKDLENVLLVGESQEFPSDTTIKKMIIYPDGERAFFIVDPEKQ